VRRPSEVGRGGERAGAGAVGRPKRGDDRRDAGGDEQATGEQRANPAPVANRRHPLLGPALAVKASQQVVERQEADDVSGYDRVPRDIGARAPPPAHAAVLAVETVEVVVGRSDEQAILVGHRIARGSFQFLLPGDRAGGKRQRDDAPVLDRHEQPVTVYCRHGVHRGSERSCPCDAAIRSDDEKLSRFGADEEPSRLPGEDGAGRGKRGLPPGFTGRCHDGADSRGGSDEQEVVADDGRDSGGDLDAPARRAILQRERRQAAVAKRQVGMPLVERGGGGGRCVERNGPGSRHREQRRAGARGGGRRLGEESG
jgi:hypothetical protein